MEKFILKNEPIEKRRGLLKESCDKIIDFSYMKNFEPDELVDFKNRLSDIMISVDEIETELDDIKSEFKEKLKPLKSEVKELLTWIRNKALSVKEECYMMYEKEKALIYNGAGELVHERPLTAPEKQSTIFKIGRDNKKEATNN